ncbi:MAG: transporter [Leeuwenhoekiella sp.]
MRAISFYFLLFIVAISDCFGQYTETINSNRPGQSQGAFSVGRGVLQLESGLIYSDESHEILATETSGWGADFLLRYGLLFEQLEINVGGSYAYETITRTSGNAAELNQSGFPRLMVGLKFLIYDPYKNYEKKVNLYSYHANNKPDWRALIPAVSVYSGTNFVYNENPFFSAPGVPAGSQEGFTPQAALITQHNYMSLVWVNNIIADYFTTDYPTYTWITTLTHSFDEKFAGFVEYQLINSDIYADDLVRFGGAFLASKNFQLDLSALMNFKETPRRLQITLGLSFRLDGHKDPKPSLTN